jgi:ABC-type antimicrobial peptide transport system permease subunit
MRFFLSILGVIIFVVLVIVIIASGNSGGNIVKPVNLVNYNTPNSAVTQITTGPLVADEQRQALKITISQSQRTIEVLSGYNQIVTKTEILQNNPASYSVFLGALANASYTTSRKTNQINMFGVCPLGNTYQYQSYNGTKTLSNLWSTSCALSDGNFAGNGPLIRQLFALQFPDYNTFSKATPQIYNPIYN